MIFNTKPTSTIQVGEIAEERALQHLKKHQLKFVEKNYRCAMGEIDLIMEDGSTLVFVEVRFRKNSAFGSAVESVTPAKQKKVRNSAQHYLLTQKIGESRPTRFDIVGIDNNDIVWLQNAF